MDSGKLLIILPLLLSILPLALIIIVIVFITRKLRSSKSQETMEPSQEKRWLAYRALALPVLFILPFFVNRFYQFPCPNPQEFAGPCYQIGSGLGGWLGLIAIIFGGSMLFSVRATWKRGQKRAEFAKTQLYVSLIAVAITLVLYAIFYQFSQGKYLNLLDGTSPPSHETLAKVQNHPFGVSFPVLALAAVSLIYLLAPISQWWNTNKDRGRVTGVKKKELFQ
jgi:hypothetical protein